MMGALRRQRYLAWLALVALALQLGLSFGHHHAHYNAAHYVASTLQNYDGAPSRPADDHDENHCPICLTIGLLSATALPALLLLRAPTEYVSVGRSVAVASVVTALECAAFRARAPPKSV